MAVELTSDGVQTTLTDGSKVVFLGRYFTWLADEFSYQLWRTESHSPNLSLDAFHPHPYLSIDGSHVSAYGRGFGNAATVTVGEFLRP